MKLRSLLLVLPILAIAASCFAQDPAAKTEDSAAPRHAIFGIGTGFGDSRWAWPGEDVVVEGFVLALGLSLFEAHNGVGFGLGAQWADNTLNGVHLSLVQHDASTMRGVQIAGLLNTGGRSEGLQIAGFANFIPEGAGVQISLFMNGNRVFMPPRNESYRDWYAKFDANEFAGVQLALLRNAASCLKGVQIGLFNLAEVNLRGIQFGLLNASDDVRGLQIGAINRARHLKGVQIGILNSAANAAIPCLPLLNAHF